MPRIILSPRARQVEDEKAMEQGCQCRTMAEWCPMSDSLDSMTEGFDRLDDTLNGEHGLMTNHFPHMQADIQGIKAEANMMKWIVGIALALWAAGALTLAGVMISLLVKDV